MIDSLLKTLAILGIKIYQAFGRRLLRRNCLFHPSCSRLAIFFFREYGFWKGLELTRKQLSECKGDYSLRMNLLGEVEMITLSGNIVPECDLNPRIAMRIKQFQFHSIDT